MLEVERGPVEPVPDIRIRGEMEHGVASLERAPKTFAVEHVTLHELDTGVLECARDELSPATGQVVVDDDLDSRAAQAVCERAADKARAAGDQCPAHSV